MLVRFLGIRAVRTDPITGQHFTVARTERSLQIRSGHLRVAAG